MKAGKKPYRKIRLEYVTSATASPDSLAFWNSENGDDVVCELRGGRLFLHEYDANGYPLPSRRIGLGEFLRMVVASHDGGKRA